MSITTPYGENIVNLMIDELRFQRTDFHSRSAVIKALTEAEFTAEEIKEHAESAAMTGWLRYGGDEEWNLDWPDQKDAVQ